MLLVENATMKRDRVCIAKSKKMKKTKTVAKNLSTTVEKNIRVKRISRIVQVRKTSTNALDKKVEKGISVVDGRMTKEVVGNSRMIREEAVVVGEVVTGLISNVITTNSQTTMTITLLKNPI